MEAGVSCTRCSAMHSLSVPPPLLCREYESPTSIAIPAAESVAPCASVSSSGVASGSVRTSSSSGFYWPPAARSSGRSSGSPAPPSPSATPISPIRLPASEALLPHSATFPTSSSTSTSASSPTSTQHHFHMAYSPTGSAPAAAADSELRPPAAGCACACHQRATRISESSDSGAVVHPNPNQKAAHSHAHSQLHSTHNQNQNHNHNAHMKHTRSTEHIQNLSASLSSCAFRKVLLSKVPFTCSLLLLLMLLVCFGLV